MNFLCVGCFEAESFSKREMVEQVWDRLSLRNWISLKSVGYTFTSDFGQWEHESDSTVREWERNTWHHLKTAPLGSKRVSPTELSRFQWRLGRDENRSFCPWNTYIHYLFCKLACRVSVLSWVWVCGIYHCPRQGIPGDHYCFSMTS